MKSPTKPALRVVPAAQVQLSLAVEGVLHDVRHAFFGLCVNAGRQVLTALMEADRVALCGLKGVPDANRRATRGGHTAGAVVLGGQRIGIKRPRVRSLERGELQLPAYELPAPDEPLSVSKSAASRRFVSLSQEQLHEWLTRSLAELDLPVVMIDGIHFQDRVILVALGIDSQGNKHVLGLREGSTEATLVVRSLLADLIERGLDSARMRLWVIDGGKALRKAIVECFGTTALIQRCQEHKRRNVIEHLPEELHASVNRSLRDAWHANSAALAKKQLLRLVASLHAQHPGAAASLKEGLDETLTVQGLGLTGALYRTLRTTNPIENLNGSIAHYTRNVKRWKDGLMVLRWVASALSDAQGRMRKLRGYREMKFLISELEKRAPTEVGHGKLKAA